MSLRQEVYQYFAHRTMAVVVVSAAVVGSTALAVDGWKSTHARESAAPTVRTLDAMGTATRHLVPNHVTWTITLHDHAEDKASAISAVRSDAETAHTWLSAQGIKDGELAFAPGTAAVDDSTVTRHQPDGTEYQEDVSTGFDASLVITVSSTDITRIVDAARLAGLAEELVGAEMDDPSCSAPDASQLEQPLLAEARKDARVKAEAALADYGGAHLGKLVNANIGTFALGVTCTELTATATAQVSYELE